MSLLHNPTYTNDYTIEHDSFDLRRLLWSQFMCKCGSCRVDTGQRLMEKLPVYILDQIAVEERIRFDIELAYVCKIHADNLLLTSQDSHRAGLAVKIRVLNPKKRLVIIRGLIVRGVTRIALNEKYIYFDVDDLKQMSFYYH